MKTNIKITKPGIRNVIAFLIFLTVAQLVYSPVGFSVVQSFFFIAGFSLGRLVQYSVLLIIQGLFENIIRLRSELTKKLFRFTLCILILVVFTRKVTIFTLLFVFEYYMLWFQFIKANIDGVFSSNIAEKDFT